jgi:sortase A
MGTIGRRRVLAGALVVLTGAACATPVALPGRPAELAPARMALPTRLGIPSLGLDARIAPAGLDADGAMAAPGTADEVAWYELGPRPGERGNAVLAGHNVWNGRQGAFAGLGRLKIGDRIVVATSARANFPYIVDRIVRYRADEAPIAEVFGTSGEPTLTLITCVGARDAKGDYPDRLVVRARGLR